jgi:CRP-like cAMP-binding protein
MVEISQLRGLDLLNTFSDKQLEELAAITDRRTYKTNAVIYRQSQPAKEIFVINKGLVSMRGLRSKDGLTLAFELFEAGDLFGAASLMKDQIYTLTAVCLEDTELLVIDAGRLSKVCELDFELGYRLMKKVAQLYFDRFEVAKRELGVPVATTKAVGVR